MKKILIIGATSGIASACARIWAREKSTFFLVARNSEKLSQTKDDLLARGAGEVQTYMLDLNKFDAHQKMLDTCFSELNQVDIALIAHGTLPNQKACEEDVNLALSEFSSNCLSVIALLTLLGNHMETQQLGTIAVISSVAGDRGRPSNYLYGTAKAAITTFCEGLRARLFKSNVHVLVIKPGFVATPMTADLNLPTRLTASPESVAKDIHRAILKKRDTLYTPWFWALIMFMIRMIPTVIFKRLKL